ncbi:MAG: dihydroorotase [candidate division WOR-3 bacterium]
MGLLLKGARLFSPGDGVDRKGDVLVENGRISQIGEIDPGGHEVVDLSGLTLMPGFVDLHAHLREPGEEYKETIETGALSAVRGGYTTIVSMPNTQPPIDGPEGVKFIIKRAREADLARVLPAGAITKAREGKELAEMGLMAMEGALMFTDDGSWVSSSSVMRRALEYASGIGGVIASHPEDKTLSGDACAHEGPITLKLGFETAPREAEDIAVSRDLFLCGLTGARLHLQHISSVGSVELVRRAKDVGLPVSAEVTPHHLLFTYELLETYDTVYKVNPPLREERDRSALIEALCDGTLDAIATDHAPHSPLDKEYEFPLAAPGMIWLELAFSALYTDLVIPGRITLERLVEALTVGPARVLGIEDIGHIREGALADLVAWDLNEEWEVRDLASRSRNTPFLGKTLKAKPKRVWIDGNEKGFEQSLRA